MPVVSILCKTYSTIYYTVCQVCNTSKFIIKAVCGAYPVVSQGKVIEKTLPDGRVLGIVPFGGAMYKQVALTRTFSQISALYLDNFD